MWCRDIVSENFLKYMKAIFMKSPNDGGNGVLTFHLFSPNEAFSTGTGLHSTELKPPNNPGYSQDK